jgi:hypothetical protein
MPESPLCTECGEASTHWNHADKNREGHFFTTEAATLSGRDLNSVVPEKPKRKAVVLKATVAGQYLIPFRRGLMPSVHDYKFWLRSQKRQAIVLRALERELATHEEALERVTLEAEVPSHVSLMVLTPDIADETRAMIEQLGQKLEIRKRVAPEGR